MGTRSFLLAMSALLLLAVGCSSTTSADAGSGTTASMGPSTPGSGPVPVLGPCPVEPVPVVVSVDQWGDVVKALAGRCGEVTTIIEGSSADPHDYEPTASDSAKFGKAELVVLNGVGYDEWAQRALETRATKPLVVNGGEVVGAERGANPHIWYSPDYVDQVSRAVTAELKKAAPGADAYFDQQASQWRQDLQPYRDEIASIKKLAVGKKYGATESVFDYMAAAVGLNNVTPEGYQSAASNGSDPAPGDVHDFDSLLANGGVDVLIFNTQTEGSIPEQLRDAATSRAIPVVNVTETVPPGSSSFVAWQLSQLQSLAKALG